MPNCKPTAKSLSEWFATPQGGYVLAREQAHFDRTLSDMFGYNALQLGLPEHDFLHSSRIPLHISGASQAGNAVRIRHTVAESSGSGAPASHPLPQSADSAITGDLAGVVDLSGRVAGSSPNNVSEVRLICTELPFDSDCMDLVVLPHTLEFAAYPHQILREAARVLRPEGNLIISGFNPHSLWGLHRALGRRQGYPWQGQFIALHRIRDWLALLGFEVAGARFAAYAPPFHQSKWLERFSFMERAGDRWWAVSGGVYFVHAIKRVHGMRLIKPKWKEGLVGKLLPVAPKLNNKITQRNETEPQ